MSETVDKKKVFSRLDIEFLKKLSEGVDGDDAETVYKVAPLMAGRCKDIFSFMTEYKEKYGRFPSWDLVEEAFQDIFGSAHVDYSDIRPKEPIKYYVDQLVERHIGVAVVDETHAINETVKEGNVWEAVERYRQATKRLNALLTSFSREKVADLSNPVGVIERYDKRAELFLGGKVEGIRTPWQSLTQTSFGIKKKQVWVLAARMKVGKTFGMLLFGISAWTEGMRPLFVSMEMPDEEIQDRFYAMYAGLPFEDFMTGRLSTEARKKFINALEEVKQKHPMWVVDPAAVRTVDDLRGYIESKTPDLLIVDSFYMLKPTGRPQQYWERIAELVDETKRLAQEYNIPVLLSTQFNREGGRKRSGAGEYLAFSMQIGRTADVVMGLFSNKKLRADKQMVVEVFEARAMKPMAIKVHWDLDCMNFSEIRAVYDEEEFKDLVGEDEEEDSDEVEWN